MSVKILSEMSANQRLEFLSASPLWLVPTEGSRAAQICSALAPPDAQIVAIGTHNFLSITAATWISGRNEINVTVKGDRSEVGRSLLVRIWTRDSRAVNRTVWFETQGDSAIATAEMDIWNGQPVAGVVLLSLLTPEEKS